jgi:hypothetical protein
VDDLHDTLRPILVDALVAVAIIALGYISAAIVKAKNVAVDRLSQVSRDAGWQAAVDKLNTASQNAVLATEQTVVRQLRDARGDGRLTADEAHAVLTEAVKVAKLHIGPEAMVEIMGSLQLTPDRLEQLLRQTIEAAVAKAKGGRLGQILELPAPE